VIRDHATSEEDANVKIFASSKTEERKGKATLVSSFCVAGGISDVQADDEGVLWISLFEDDTRGNIKAYSKDGKCVFDFNVYNEHQTFKVPPFVEPYAMNITANHQGNYFYYRNNDFTLVNLNKRKLNCITRRSPVLNANYMAISKDSKEAVLAGGKLRGTEVVSSRIMYRILLETLEVEEFEVFDWAGNPLYCIGAIADKLLMKVDPRDASSAVYCVTLGVDL
jgi:hypothetical protein